jgi:probable HAF family extracellular repeat protein
MTAQYGSPLKSNHHRLVFAVIGLLISLLVNPALALSRYDITDLGSLGGDSSVATDINNQGQVCGSSTTSQGKTHAFRYTDGVGMLDLGVAPNFPPADSSAAYGINDRGQVVGESANNSFRYTDGVGMENLSDAHCAGLDTCLGLASQINANGQVIGKEFSNATGQRYRAIRFTDGLAKEISGVVQNDRHSYGIDINDPGQFVGYSDDSGLGTYYHAFRVTDGLGMESLGSLGGSINAGGEYSANRSVSQAWGINKTAQVTGKSSTTSLRWHGFLFTDGTGMVDLGVLQGDDSSSGVGINDSGHVVGQSWNSNGGLSHPVLWTRAGCPEDLNSAPGIKESGWTLGQVRSINNNGQIVGTGKSPEGKSHAFRLTPMGASAEPQCPASTGGGGAPAPAPAPPAAGGGTGGSGYSGGGGGGGCTINSSAGFDWSFVIMLLFGLGLRPRRRAMKAA